MSNLMDYGNKTMGSKEVHQVINCPVDDNNVKLTISYSVVTTKNYNNVQRKKSDEQMRSRE